MESIIENHLTAMRYGEFMVQASEASSPFEIKFTSREVSAWRGMALMKRMLDSMNFRSAASQWNICQSHDPIAAIRPCN